MFFWGRNQLLTFTNLLLLAQKIDSSLNSTISDIIWALKRSLSILSPTLREQGANISMASRFQFAAFIVRLFDSYFHWLISAGLNTKCATMPDNVIIMNISLDSVLKYFQFKASSRFFLQIFHFPTNRKLSFPRTVVIQ